MLLSSLSMTMIVMPQDQECSATGPGLRDASQLAVHDHDCYATGPGLLMQQ